MCFLVNSEHWKFCFVFQLCSNTKLCFAWYNFCLKTNNQFQDFKNFLSDLVNFPWSYPPFLWFDQAMLLEAILSSLPLLCIKHVSENSGELTLFTPAFLRTCLIILSGMMGYILSKGNQLMDLFFPGPSDEHESVMILCK